MTSAGGTGAGSPLIAGVGISSGDFHDYSDDEFAATNLFDFSNSPDTLQTLETIGTTDQKPFLKPQDLTTGPFPESPNSSYQDSSSESASSTKRTGSSASAKTPATTVGDATMDNNDVKMEWGNGNFAPFDDDDHTFNFNRETESSDMNGLYGFNEQDDSFMDRSFDFESASASPQTLVTGGPASIASPGMPTIKTNSPKKSGGAKKGALENHKKHGSQSSMSSAMNGLKTAGSREVSPMSAMVTSHDSSPAAAAFFNSPPSYSNPDFSRSVNGNNAMWPSAMDGTNPIGPDGLPMPMHFGGHRGQPIPLPQQMPLFNPAYNFTGGYELRIMPTPLKSRVETQIPIKMALTPLPPGVTKLHLPTHTISKPKLLARPTPEPSADTLELFVSVVCTSAMDLPDAKRKALERAAKNPRDYLPDLDDEENSPQNGGDVRICIGCITRERKRAARKKVKKPEEEKVWSQDEERRVVVFNTQEIKEWQPLTNIMDASGRPDPVIAQRAMQVDAPMRIACYCRHQNEKMGFNVIFTIKDYQDRIIAQAMSNPIMITDDHKTHPMTQLTSQPPMSEPVTTSTIPGHHFSNLDAANLSPPAAGAPVHQNGGFALSPSNSDLASSQHNGQSLYQGSGKTTPTMSTVGPPSRMLSRPSSPSLGAPAAKKRKSSGPTRVPNELAMTRLDMSPTPGTQGTQLSAATSPYASHANGFPQPDQLFGNQGSFVNSPPTPGNSDQVPFFANNRSASMDNLAMANLYSAPTSNHPSRAPSPNGIRNGLNVAAQHQFTQALANSLYTMPMNVNQTRPPPVIHKIIPNEGPKIGGIEVTVLGAAFFQGLDVWFGDQKATTTTYWGDSSLVCLLPPSAVAGAVPVTFKHQGLQTPQNFPMAKQPPMFKYIDDNEDKLIRTALSVLGHKMSGQMVDVSDLARRILNDGNSGWSSGGGSSGGPSAGPAFNQASHEHLESQLLKCLDLIDLDDSAHRTRLDLKSTAGHTMLHLACSLGYHRFVAALLARGANPDARDKGGFTPLHMAAIQSHSEIVRRLMLVGADPTIRTLSSLTAADVAQSRAVLRAIRHSERHVRSRSSGASLHSRASSAASLRSLWEPVTRAHTHDEPLAPDSGEESPEYTSGDFEDEDPDENSFLTMRRRSTGLRQDNDRSSSLGEDTDGSDEGIPSPKSALTAALKEQFQQQLHQLQQTMALHFQNLPQLPQIPQMPALPGMPVLPDYQAYFQQAPFVRRVQQLMPNMTGVRPGSAEGPNHAKVDARWWDLSAYMGNGTVPPPAYEDIFPQKDMDTKQASAAQAAADAEADMKCSTLYDETSTTTTTAVEVKTQLPSILKIGRKNAITREQQEQFLRARAEKLKKLSSDRNLFFIWIPLLVLMVCAMLYSYFPALFPFLWTSVRAVVQAGQTRASRVLGRTPGRVVEL